MCSPPSFATPATAALIVTVLLALGTATPSRATTDTPPIAEAFGTEASFIDAVKTFQAARNGKTDEVDHAVAAFDALARTEPRLPLYPAYLGSALVLKGRDAWMPWSKLKYAQQGLDQIDQALAALKPEHDRQLLRGVPVSIETRLVAASTFINMPDSIFHRAAAGKTLIAEVIRDPTFAASPPAFRATGYLTAAKAARQEEQLEEEIAQLKRALGVTDSGPAADQARARLKELGQ